MPQTGARPELHPAFRFTVKIDGISYAAFTECTLPNLQVETKDVIEGGQNEYVHKLPLRVKAGSVKLRHGITRDAELLAWYLQVLNGDIASAMRTVEVVMYSATLEQIGNFTFLRSYPIKWTGPTLKTGEQAIAIEELELAHHGFTKG